MANAKLEKYLGAIREILPMLPEHVGKDHSVRYNSGTYEEKEMTELSPPPVCQRFVLRLFIITVLMFGGLSVSSCAGVPKGQPMNLGNRQQEIVRLVQSDDFIQIFRRADAFADPPKDGKRFSIFPILNGAVKSYTDLCCQTRESLVELLKDSGFKVEVKVDAVIKDAGVETRYDERISGERSFSVFLYTSMSYRVSFYLKDKKVVKIYAWVDTTSL